MPIKLANNASGTLATAISASDTGIVLTSGNGALFPSLAAGEYFYATLASSGGTLEIVKVTARSGDSLTVVRAQEGTSAAGFAAGARFELRVTAQSVRDAIDDVNAAAVDFTPYGSVSSTNVQSAIQEVVDEINILSTNTFTVEVITATAAQTVFNLSNPYVVGSTNLSVYMNGLRLRNVVDYVETNSTRVTLTSGAQAGDELTFVAGREVNDGLAASSVSFLPAGTGAIARTAQDKLRDTVSVKDFGAVGNGIANDTDAIQLALNSGATKVYVPAGTYRVGTLYVNSDQEFYGDGAASVLQALDATTNSQYIVATYAYSGGTSNPADNKRNIYVHDLKLDGRNRDLGYQAFVHAMTINATTDMVVERVMFYDFRGDGCYVGSGTTGGIERHNINITFRDCIFDGVGKYNRNGLSVIDCDDITVDGCSFRNIGNTALSSSVGAIDFEPNSDFNIYRHVKITNCVFKDIDSTNTSGVTFFNSRQVTDNIYDWVVDSCSFVRCYWGVSSSTKNKTPSSDPDCLVITNCTFRNSTLEDIRVNGLKDVVVSGNSFSLYPKNSSSYRGGIQVGSPTSGLPEPAIDAKISNNSFSGLRPQFGAVSVRSARGLRVDNNSFEDISGACVQLLTNVTTGFRYLEDIVITNNKANTSSTGISPNTTGLVLANAGIDNEFINSTCVLDNNVVLNAIQLNRATALAVFREQPLSAAPTTGSWEAGNKVQVTLPSAGSLYYACSVSGTFGTLTGVTADATNGSNAITNVAGTDFSLLREGQYITVSGDATVRRIILIDGTAMYLSGNYGGATGTGKTLAWSPPTFVVA